jgi:hypothetical protein
MITNMYMGFPFGIISVLLHALLLVTDTRRSFGFYNVSLFLWVCGNFIWMTIEFTDINPSSDVHLGPQVPTGGISDRSIYIMTQTKTVMFLIGVLVQIAFYICIFTKRIPMPEQADEDIIIRNEATLFLLGQRSYTATSDIDSILDMDEESPEYQDMDAFHTQGDGSPQLTLAFIESGYIIFWIFKDLFWSFGTGDLNTEFGSVIVYEILAMTFGFTALCVYLVTAYIYRRKMLRFLDSLTTVFWISANYVWMCGEFFIRYNNLQFDDADPGNDRNTRIASATLFCAGMLTQVYVVIVLYLRYREKQQGRPQTSNYAVANGGVPKIDLFGLKGIVQYQTIMTGFSPQHQPERVGGNLQHVATEEEDHTVLF